MLSKLYSSGDDALVHHGFVRRLSLLMPIIVVYMTADLMLSSQAMTSELFKRLAMLFSIFAGVWMLDAVLLAVREIYYKSTFWKRTLEALKMREGKKLTYKEPLSICMANH